ncbi:MAG TPA: hypothetical protein VH370_04400 [Humisphaera sp.]|jgi:hypothetical protein|nr:hypothetical protein [Humisphaera sp.]
MVGQTEITGIFVERLAEIGEFFDGTGRVHQAMRRIADRLQAAGIRYAIIGGMAVNAHRHSRTTMDVDFLLSPDGLRELRRCAAANEFDPVPGRTRRFIDRPTGITFDALVAGMFPGNGTAGPIAFPEPATVSTEIDGLHVVDLPTLIQLKLAAHRYQDFADVINLIRANGLDDRFRDKLHPSVQSDYIECIEEMRREDDYEARQDRASE